MNDNEIFALQELVKKKYNENGKDFNTFDFEINENLSFLENKDAVEKYLKGIFPTEQEKQEAEAKAKFEAEIEKIINTKTSEELEKLYFKPNEYIRMVASGKEKGLLLYGESSLGKSYRVKKVLTEEGKVEGKDYFIISGHITPLQFYKKLYFAKDKLVVFDDVNILESKINLNMLKAALNEYSYGRVEYHTTTKMPDGIPSSFIFTGQVIILLNDKPKNSEHLKAVESRVIPYHLKFTYEEIIRIITDIAKQEQEGTTQQERFEIVKWIKDNTNKGTKNLNIRLYQHAVRFYVWNKACWKELAGSYIQNDEYSTLIIEGCSPEKWVEETGLSLATYKRFKKELGLSRAYGVVKNG